MVKRAGIWVSNPDLVAFAELVEELQARAARGSASGSYVGLDGVEAVRGPSAAPKGHRFGLGLTGAAYYRDVEVWAASPRPDIAGLWRVVEELRRRQQAETDGSFVTRLRARLDEVAGLSITDRRQRVGISDELLEAALAGVRLAGPVMARLRLFVGEAV